ncbi:biotin/lipoyl-binding protein, partial [bacterium]|nr:biotin/lipoyl-binding protein [bacterium]
MKIDIKSIKTKPVWIFVVGLIIVVFVIRLISGIGRDKVVIDQNAGLPLVEVQNLKSGAFEDTLFLTGTIKGSKEVDLKFPVSGKIDKFYFKQGDKVKKGEVIVALSQEKAKLMFEKKELELRNITKLYELNAVSPNKMKDAELDYKLAEAEFNDTEIRASED